MKTNNRSSWVLAVTAPIQSCDHKLGIQHLACEYDTTVTLSHVIVIFPTFPANLPQAKSMGKSAGSQKLWSCEILTVMLGSDTKSEEDTNDQQPASEVPADDVQPTPVPQNGLLFEQTQKVGLTSNHCSVKRRIWNYCHSQYQSLEGCKESRAKVRDCLPGRSPLNELYHSHLYQNGTAGTSFSIEDNCPLIPTQYALFCEPLNLDFECGLAKESATSYHPWALLDNFPGVLSSLLLTALNWDFCKPNLLNPWRKM